MRKNLMVGEEVLIFSRSSGYSSVLNTKFVRGKVTKVKSPRNYSHKDNVWYEEVYEVLGEDGKVYSGKYLIPISEEYYFMREEDYITNLNSMITTNEESIKKIKKENEEINNRILKMQEEKMNRCSHLCVKLREGFFTSSDEYIPSIIECVHCGITNKYDEILEQDDAVSYYEDHPSALKRMELASNMFKKIYGSRFDEILFDFISTEELPCDNPMMLYRSAKEEKPDGTNEEIFAIMKKRLGMEKIYKKSDNRG